MSFLPFVFCYHATKMEMPQLQLLDEHGRTYAHMSGTDIELPEFIFSDLNEGPLHPGLEINKCSPQLENTHQNASSVVNSRIYAPNEVIEKGKGHLSGPESVLQSLQDIEGADYEFDCSVILPPPLNDRVIDPTALKGTWDEKDSTTRTGTPPFEYVDDGVQDDILDLQPLVEPYNNLNGRNLFSVHDTGFESTPNHGSVAAQSSVGFEPNQVFQGVRDDFFAELDITGMVSGAITQPSSVEIPDNVVDQAGGGSDNLVYDNREAPPFSSVSPEKEFPRFNNTAASQVNSLQTGADGEMNGSSELLPNGYGNMVRENETGFTATANVLDEVRFGEFVSQPAIVPSLPVDSLPVQGTGRKRRAAPVTSSNREAKKSRTKVQDLDPALVHVCTVEGCNRKFAKKYNLKIHLRRHNGDLPFLCEYSGCSKRFMWLSSFSRHQRVHESKQHKKRKLHELGGRWR